MALNNRDRAKSVVMLAQLIDRWIAALMTPFEAQSVAMALGLVLGATADKAPNTRRAVAHGERCWHSTAGGQPSSLVEALLNEGRNENDFNSN